MSRGDKCSICNKVEGQDLEDFNLIISSTDNEGKRRDVCVKCVSLEAKQIKINGGSK